MGAAMAAAIAEEQAAAAEAGGASTQAADLPLEEIVLPAFDEEEVYTESTQPLSLLHDVQLHVKIELGRTRMFVEDVLHLGEGSVVELDRLAGDPVDVFVNERLVARGEVLVLNDNFCVRVSEIISGTENRAAG
ncbi:MAG: flagellar motor switch protein FliN [Planctomycetes bacterium]|nr:flagellar motor switch protein FliN [Planctomycetota bacterium]